MKYNRDRTDNHSPQRNRRSMRLKGYDYSQPGAYFVTICTQNRECLFGKIVDGEMVLNDAGRMVQTTWNEIPEHYLGVNVDAFVVMPNHIHGIVIIVGAGPRACPDTEPQGGGQFQTGQPQGVAPTLSLPDVVHRFKTMATKRYADGAKQLGWTPFPDKLWQRNYPGFRKGGRSEAPKSPPDMAKHSDDRRWRSRPYGEKEGESRAIDGGNFQAAVDHTCEIRDYYEHIIRDEDELNQIREYILHNPLKWELDRYHPSQMGNNLDQSL